MDIIVKSTFETLDAWKKGRELRIEIQKLTVSFPKEEKYRLVDQMIRASRSVTNNMAEGYGMISLSGKYSILSTSKRIII